MTKAFLEPMVLKPENEKFILEAFSNKSLKKVQAYDSKKRASLKKRSVRKLSVSDLF
jgi:hypothetical protein